MKTLTHQDRDDCERAKELSALGRPQDAITALDTIPEERRNHPYVLALRWAIYAKAGLWQLAELASMTFLFLLPNSPGGKVRHAESLHRIGRSAEAAALLGTLSDRFERSPDLPYNLARYQCGARDFDAARDTLQVAFRSGGHAWAFAATQEPDLEPLLYWTERKREAAAVAT